MNHPHHHHHNKEDEKVWSVMKKFVKFDTKLSINYKKLPNMQNVKDKKSNKAAETSPRNHHQDNTIKIKPEYLDDINKQLDRREIIHLYEVIMKETHGEYKNQYLDNLFNELYSKNKKLSFKNLENNDNMKNQNNENDKKLPSLTENNVNDSKEDEDNKYFEEVLKDSFDSELNEKKNIDTFNRNRLVSKLQNYYKFYREPYKFSNYNNECKMKRFRNLNSFADQNHTNKNNLHNNLHINLNTNISKYLNRTNNNFNNFTHINNVSNNIRKFNSFRPIELKKVNNNNCNKIQLTKRKNNDFVFNKEKSNYILTSGNLNFTHFRNANKYKNTLNQFYSNSNLSRDNRSISRKIKSKNEDSLDKLVFKYIKNNNIKVI